MEGGEVMGKTIKGKEKAKAKVARAKEKIARKCGKAAKVVIAIACLSVLFAGCQGTSTPSRSQNLTIKDCTINVYGSGTETNEVARVEIATQAMSIENSGTESQTATPTQTTDVKPDIDVHYNDAIKNATDASKGVLETLASTSANKVLEMMASKETGTVEVTKKDGTTATVECKDGQCAVCTDCTAK